MLLKCKSLPLGHMEFANSKDAFKYYKFENITLQLAITSWAFSKSYWTIGAKVATLSIIQKWCFVLESFSVFVQIG